MFLRAADAASDPAHRRGRGEAARRQGGARGAGADRLVHHRGAQSRADRRRRVRTGALPDRSRQPPGRKTKSPRIVEDDVRAVVRAGRLVQHTPVKRPRPARSREDASAWACCTTRAASSRSKRWRFAPRRRARAGFASTTPRARWPSDSVFNATSVLRAVTGLDPTTSTCTSTSSAAETSTVRRPAWRSFSRSTPPLTKTRAAAGRRGHRRAVDSRQGARRRRRRREALRRAPSRHEDRAWFRRRTRARLTRG